MIDAAPRRSLEPPAAVYAACAASFAIALVFIFVRAPHPWGWDGFDHYHDLALELARGRPFPTMEVPWGYAYFLAAFYRLFGDHPWIPLVVQAALNAAVPALVYRFACTWLDRRTAAIASILTGLFSFNTVYASTQSSDALCTCLFMAAIVAFAAARRRESARWFAIVGILSGVVPQFRPNLILIPPLLAAFAVWERRSRRRAAHAALLLACAAAALLPWVVRNYRLTGLVLPTSVHGGVQLWYGTLQIGPYLHSRAYSPRSVFEAAAFEYTSLENVPIIVEAQVNCAEETLTAVALAYRFDDGSTEVHLPPARVVDNRYTFEIPPPRREAVVYYYFVTNWSGTAGPMVRTTPRAGPSAPFIYFVSRRHLTDLDVHGELLDVFDVVRLIRSAAWNDPVLFADRLQAVGARDTRTAIALLMRRFVAGDPDRIVTALSHDETEARVTLWDGSTITVPRRWSGNITDLTVSEGAAASLMTSRISLAALEKAGSHGATGAETCTQVGDVGINQVFYRREPHMMSRYWALALDNIRRDPSGFVRASAYRAVRLFVIKGSSDRFTAQQFSQSRRAYAAGTAASIVFVGLFAAGVVVAWRRGYSAGLALLLIAYVPATLAPVLTNMRYTITIQPLMFIFMAVAISALTNTARRSSVR